MFVACRNASRDQASGSNTMASRITKSFLTATPIFEEFDVSTPDRKLRIKAQTLRLYNPESHQWSIYLVDLDKGTLDIPPVVGQFYGKRGEFYNQQTWEGRAVLVRYVWLDISPKSSRMEQSFRRRRKDMGSQLDL
jgi:hypothetical protein